MPDTMTQEQRSRSMEAIRGKDTKPEMLVRKFLFAKGLRFRVCDCKLPGKPDIVLPKYRTVIFIDGCFWHGHDDCKYSQTPKTNTEFWKNKIHTNRLRDCKNEADLINAGWNVIRLWECKIRHKATRMEFLENLYERIIGSLQNPKPYAYPSTSIPLAAEPSPKYTPYHLSLIKSETTSNNGTSLTIIEWEDSQATPHSLTEPNT